LNARFSTGDVVQSVFEGVLRDAGVFQGNTESAFIGYLAVVVQNRIIDAIRFHEAAQRDGRRGKSIVTGFDATGSEVDPADAAATQEELERLHAALQRFDPREQHLLRARIEGLASFRELAEQLGYGSESAARRVFFDAQARLVLWLKEGE
jgi:RNA polymerase sigma factor (sigma-70 family)